MFVRVFTDAKAAALGDREEEQLSKAERALYRRHHVGTYLRDRKAGKRAWRAWPQGRDGPLFPADY